MNLNIKICNPAIHSAIASLSNPSRGIRTHVGGSISITATFGSNSKAINHSYDANGNLTQLSTELTTPNQTGTALANPYNNQQYTYDAQNRLTAVQDNQGNLIASYQYDPYGQRIRKTIHRSLITDSNNPNVGTWQALTTPNTFSYFYRDEGLSSQYQTAGQDVTAATSSNITTPKQISQYGWLPNGIWGTNPIWINTAKRTTTTVNSQTQTTISPADYYYYQNDHLGTPQQLTDSAGNLVWQQKSTAFGETQVTLGDATNETNNAVNNTNTTPSTGVIANPFRFAGQYYDIETNTNYNYHRQYRMAGGGYTQTDPIGLEGGMNRYSYVMGNPLTRIDPSGEQCKGTWYRFKWIKFFAGPPRRDGAKPLNGFKNMPSFICKCFWYCQDCRNTPNLIGDGDGLPSTVGFMFFSGNGNGIEGGNECLCSKPSEEKPCRECEAN